MAKKQIQRKPQIQRKSRKGKKSRKKERIKSNIGTLSVSFVVFALAAVIAYTPVRSSGLKDKRDTYKQREENLKKQIEKEVERSSELEEYEKYVQTRKYIEEIAKEKLGLVYDDEIILKPQK